MLHTQIWDSPYLGCLWRNRATPTQILDINKKLFIINNILFIYNHYPACISFIVISGSRVRFYL